MNKRPLQNFIWHKDISAIGEGFTIFAHFARVFDAYGWQAIVNGECYGDWVINKEGAMEETLELLAVQFSESMTAVCGFPVPKPKLL